MLEIKQNSRIESTENAYTVTYLILKLSLMSALDIRRNSKIIASVLVVSHHVVGEEVDAKKPAAPGEPVYPG